MTFIQLARPCLIFMGLTGPLCAQLVVNSPQPITESLTVQVIGAAATDGTSPAPLFGNASEQQAIESDVNQIWAQAGIEVQFEFYPSTWDNSFALMGTAGNNSPRPASDLSTIVTDANADLELDPHANQLYMLDIVPTFSQEDSNTVVGYSFTNFDGMSMWIGPSLPTSTEGQDIAASIVAHEIGRNLGLTTDNTDNQDLMNPGGSGGELLNSTQVQDADESDFLTPVPEPSTYAMLSGAFLLLIGKRATSALHRRAAGREAQS
jgi:hypothetical protein